MVGFFFSGTAHFRSIVIAVGRRPARPEGQTALPAIDATWCAAADHAPDLPPARRRRRANGAET